MKSRRLAATAMVALAGLVGGAQGCTDVGTSPDAVVALAFDTLPFPAVVARDSMRDSLGKVAPFHALAYNAAGALIANPALQYLALDTGVLVSNGVLVANSVTSGSVRIVAAARGLQSAVRKVTITPRAPTGLAATTKASDTLKYVLPDVAATNAITLTAKLTADSAGTPVAVNGWPVSWQVLLRGQVMKPSDTTVVSLLDEANHVSVLDTAGADGTVSRKLRVRANALPVTADSFVVFATAKYRGQVVAGTPLRFVIHFRIKPPTR